MTFLKFGITSNHLANSFSSDLSYTFDAHSKVEHRGFHASDSTHLSSTMSIFVANSLGVLK